MFDCVKCHRDWFGSCITILISGVEPRVEKHTRPGLPRNWTRPGKLCPRSKQVLGDCLLHVFKLHFFRFNSCGVRRATGLSDAYRMQESRPEGSSDSHWHPHDIKTQYSAVFHFSSREHGFSKTVRSASHLQESRKRSAVILPCYTTTAALTSWLLLHRSSKIITSSYICVWSCTTVNVINKEYLYKYYVEANLVLLYIHICCSAEKGMILWEVAHLYINHIYGSCCYRPVWFSLFCGTYNGNIKLKCDDRTFPPILF